MNDNIFPSFTAMHLGATIYKKLLEINKDLSQFDKGSGIEEDDFPYILNFIEEDLKLLYDSITKLLRQDDLEVRRTYDKLYSHPRFKRETPLEVILAYTYLMVGVISENTHFQLIEDQIHQMYANALMNKNHVHFSKYVGIK